MKRYFAEGVDRAYDSQAFSGNRSNQMERINRLCDKFEDILKDDSLLSDLSEFKEDLSTAQTHQRALDITTEFKTVVAKRRAFPASLYNFFIK